ncbi:SDR family NAD(P)-dependent oxidoreductase [Budviciaceae bacterium BWR-B9]|uniref:SDR family NAD(P)-dependent oxidoreductase n=1 Tax=Limnobaculum allomyrinae TaxID=2791986 RepID=A0ABS1IMT0_9GAMM|nr:MULTISPECIES: SDR family NAD(P)-dependent oxidoreductase [Limnobaculum]MBK5143051.1 SDR family NAD(P)-dependent oxidoreductase [Limnobaculum allomyrinae]MBV7693381.1 SDR family NAD(P)-dependent oxidoreductase [Limnobaculum sp. M2-1]
MNTRITALTKYLLFPYRQPDKSALNRYLQNKTILITGASYGIGEAVAERLANCQVRLILVARTAEKLRQIQQRLNARSADCHIFSCDLTNETQCAELLHQLQQFGNIDIFINNAGKSICRPLMDSLDRLHDFQRTIRLNYLAPVQLCLGLIPMLEKTQGQIINISALNVLLAPTPYWAAYQASKTAFDQWLRCAEPELKLASIAVSSLYFPLVKTRMITPVYANKPVPALSVEQAADIICRALLTRKPCIRPWWTLLAQVTSVIFHRLWAGCCGYYLKRKSDE